MGRIPITLLGYRCERCTHEWLPKNNEQKEPKVCPKCKSPYWNVPKKQTPLTYEEFRDQVEAILNTSVTPMTWTEVRTKGKLPQKWPNNLWVHRLEKDIALVREKDNNGIIKWRIVR